MFGQGFSHVINMGMEKASSLHPPNTLRNLDQVFDATDGATQAGAASRWGTRDRSDKNGLVRAWPAACQPRGSNRSKIRCVDSVQFQHVITCYYMFIHVHSFSIISGESSIQKGFRMTRFSVCLSGIAGMTEATTNRLQKVRQADFGSWHSPSESVRRKQKWPRMGEIWRDEL